MPNQPQFNSPAIPNGVDPGLAAFPADFQPSKRPRPYEQPDDDDDLNVSGEDDGGREQAHEEARPKPYVAHHHFVTAKIYA